jgi:hypothetical protein
MTTGQILLLLVVVVVPAVVVAMDPLRLGVLAGLDLAAQ